MSGQTSEPRNPVSSVAMVAPQASRSSPFRAATAATASFVDWPNTPSTGTAKPRPRRSSWATRTLGPASPGLSSGHSGRSAFGEAEPRSFPTAVRSSGSRLYSTVPGHSVELKSRCPLMNSGEIPYCEAMYATIFTSESQSAGVTSSLL
ncbi:hypothetical protein C791_7195 [Amycolatopsis azurea DSM 43854]|uniref:Uncharacterized protein n=1 Tax=Amycolatopsis azurea DSM 43854 TaxID=1238180 RepID=M2PVF1_9PSEU|nr:hypothetical protein C791_7195 [Amycolatopsis azurea DSM 43854]